MKLSEGTKKIFLHFGLLLAATVPFWLANLDIEASSKFYDFTAKSWKYAGSMWVKVFYDLGVYPAILLTAAAAVAFGLAFMNGKMQKYRKASLLFMLALFMGPAILINVVMKNYTGRPRPRDVVEFNGRQEFRRILEFGVPGRGHSFPCGHASMGFLFMALYFPLRKKHRLAAYAALAGGLIYGSAMGAARMAQGAHFLSDVLWAAGVTFIAAEAAWYWILGGEGKSAFDRLKAGKQRWKASAAVIASLLTALVLVFLFSVPYANERFYQAKPLDGMFELVINSEGSVRVTEAPSTDFIKMKVTGFGFPGRSFDSSFGGQPAEKGVKYEFRTVKSGLFMELNPSVEVFLPKAKIYRLTVNTSKGDISCELYGDSELVALTTRDGDIDFKAGGTVKDVFIKTPDGDVETAFDVDTKLAPGSFLDLNAGGKIHMANRSAFFKELNEKGADITGSKEIFYKSTKKDGPAMKVKAEKIIVK